MNRKIKQITPERLQPISVPEGYFDLKGWLEETAGDAFCYLLAHADDGVIWGRIQDGLMSTSEYGEISPPLRLETLQTLRMFNPNCELMLWRDAGTWRARLIYAPPQGEEVHFAEAIDEQQILWGDTLEASFDTGYTLLSDGSQGLRHIVPIPVPADLKERKLRLHVRHFIQEDETGFAHITASRLLDLTVEG